MDLNKRTRRTKLIIVNHKASRQCTNKTNKQHQTILGNNDQESKQAKYLHKWQNQQHSIRLTLAQGLRENKQEEPIKRTGPRDDSSKPVKGITGLISNKRENQNHDRRGSRDLISSGSRTSQQTHYN